MSENKRSHIRISMDAQVFVEVAAATETLPSELAQCEVLDVSYGGCRVRLGSELPEGAILSVSIELPALPDPFYMAAEIKWCRADNSNDANDSKDTNQKWLAGFALIPSAESDLEQWRDLLEHV